MNTQQPKWQKARIVDLDPTTGHKHSFLHLVGKIVWVECGQPKDLSLIGLHDQVVRQRSCRTNLGGWSKPSSYMLPAGLEFQSEFSFNDVETIPYEIWSDPNWPGIE